MRVAAHQYALSTSWELIFEGLYKAYERCLQRPDLDSRGILEAAKT